MKASKTDIIVIGASSGGFEALRLLIGSLPKEFPAAVFVVLHIPSEHKSYLAETFGRGAQIKVKSAMHEDVIESGTVYVGVPDFHLQFRDNLICLDHGPKHNFHRPSVDTLFVSASKAFGSRVIGVVLTGALDDGTAGLMEIKRNGGISVVQDPKDAMNPSMPASALDCVPIDYCVPLSEMATLLLNIAGNPVSEAEVKKGEEMLEPGQEKLSTHICPECNGPMWYVESGKLIHFHCRIGHAFSGQSLLVKKSMALETALWSAVNALKDKADIAQRLAQRAEEFQSKSELPEYFERQAKTANAYVEILKGIIVKESSPTGLSNNYVER